MAAADQACKAPAAFKDPMGPASASIEVEQKFLYGPGIEEKLAALGATLQGTVSFRDTYYDTPDWCLTLADHWLREREGAGWELKRPPQSLENINATDPQPQQCLQQGQSSSSVPHGHKSQHPLQPLEQLGKPGLATQYKEVICPLEIVTQVCVLLGAHLQAGWRDNVAQAVEGLGLEEFASFVTRRRKYRLGDLSVDLDEADFGYAVGEVEAMVGQKEDVPEALKRIQKLGCQLGFDEKARIPGKMSVYLHKFRPAHYDVLVQARRLQKVASTETRPPARITSPDEERT